MADSPATPLTREQERAILGRVQDHRVARSALTRLLRNNAALTERLHTAEREREEAQSAVAKMDEINERMNENVLELARKSLAQTKHAADLTQQRDRYAAALRTIVDHDRYDDFVATTIARKALEENDE